MKWPNKIICAIFGHTWDWERFAEYHKMVPCTIMLPLYCKCCGEKEKACIVYYKGERRLNNCPQFKKDTEWINI
jgi:hypothetical protein